MTVLVTGASGFVGSAIAEALCARGIPVVGLDLHPPRNSWPGFDFVTADLRYQASLDAALTGRGLTHMIHAAALTPDAAFEEANPDLVLDVNLLGSVRLLQAAKTAGIRRLLQLSSIAVYGNAAPEADGLYYEDRTTPTPQSLYGIGKYAAEMSLRRLAPSAGIDLSNLRLGPIFGPHERASDSRKVTSPHHQILLDLAKRTPKQIALKGHSMGCYLWLQVRVFRSVASHQINIKSRLRCWSASPWSSISGSL